MKQTILEELERRLDAHQTVAAVTVLAGPLDGQALLDRNGTVIAGGFESEDLAATVATSASSYLAEMRSGRESISIDGEVHDVFFEVYPPPPQILVIGAVHVAIHLVAFGKRLGYRTVVIDPRTAFATRERFAAADELLIDWPAEALAKISITDNTYFALLAHDLKIDLPAIEVALRSPARYIGALGSKKTHAKRVAALAEAGFSTSDIARIRNPIGLDLGGRKAEEIALSIIAEMSAVRHGRG
ncbi:MAG: XdhC/CoxF family protein [bacterium]|nr:XdhC/CoxF family protein [bacterium]